MYKWLKMEVYIKIHRIKFICDEKSDVIIFFQGGQKMAFFSKMTPGSYGVIM